MDDSDSFRQYLLRMVLLAVGGLGAGGIGLLLMRDNSWPSLAFALGVGAFGLGAGMLFLCSNRLTDLVPRLILLWQLRRLGISEGSHGTQWERAEQLRGTDPAAAHQLLAVAETEGAALEGQELGALRARAITDTKAAVQLHRRLTFYLQGIAESRPRLARMARSSPEAAGELEALDRMKASIESELADIGTRHPDLRLPTH